MAKKSADKESETDEAEKSGGGKIKKLLIGVVLLAVVGGAAYWFVLKPPGPVPEPEAGEIAPLESIQINLDDGHYLKLGLALQLTTTAHEVDGSKALDAAIDLFSGRPMESMSETEKRNALKEKLAHELEESYHGDVMEVYFTEFVTQ